MIVMSKISIICLIIWLISLIISYLIVKFLWKYNKSKSSIIEGLMSNSRIIVVFILLLPFINIMICFLELVTHIPTHIDDATMDKLFLKKNKKKRDDKRC